MKASKAISGGKGGNWIQPTVINDEDLMFHNKPLSSWYEEQHQRIRNGAGEEHRGEKVQESFQGGAQQQTHMN
jgi:hypothetical protein